MDIILLEGKSSICFLKILFPATLAFYRGFGYEDYDGHETRSVINTVPHSGHVFFVIGIFFFS